MKVPTLMAIVSDLNAAMRARGIIMVNDDFDETKLDTIAEDAEFVTAVEAIFVARGVKVPARVDQIIKALPLLALFIH